MYNKKDLSIKYIFQYFYRNIPIGVLYDLYTIEDKQVDLPWQITIHFDNFPEDKLIRCSCR